MNSIEARQSPAAHSPLLRPPLGLGRGKVVAAPRSGRVAKPLNSAITSPPITAASHSSPPTIPARSPLRPRAKSTSTEHRSWSSTSSLATLVSPQTTQASQPDFSCTAKFRMAHSKAHQLDSRIDSFLSSNPGDFDSSNVSASDSTVTIDPPVKLVGSRPESPESMNDGNGGNLSSKPRKGRSGSLDSVTIVNSPSLTSSKPSQQPTLTKRKHALHELLSSERAYASDLALIRDIHIPAALGLTPLSNLPCSPANSSNSSSRTVSSSSDSSSSSFVAPMTPEDIKIIFSNITEIAMFADMFTEELEVALGAVLDGGHGNDSVGDLFLRIAPAMERPYKHYITRHPTALHHLQILPQTPALQNYLTYTQTVASSLSHAWDLASLLIKPVQRLLKYPLLLTAIIDETPDGHPDKENLRAARMTMEEVARNVNEERRRAEVVKDVLSSKTTKRPNTSVGVATSVNLSKMMSIRHGGVTAATMRVSQLTDGINNEAAHVEALQAELKRIDYFAQNFAKTVVDWAKMISNMMFAMRSWSSGFGNVIGLSAEQSSEAFDAFVDVVEKGLLPLASDLEQAINDRVLKDLAHLIISMTQPFKLIQSMDEQEPYHYHLLTMPVSAKNRPPPSLLTASSNYLALRGQLAAELPMYIRLLQKGLAVVIHRLAGIQTRFWADVRDRWLELWDMLRAETELNVGREETCAVWRIRWEEVGQCLSGLTITTPVQDVITRFLKEKEAKEREYLGMIARHREMLVREALERRERELQVFKERELEAAKMIRGMQPPSPQFRNSSRSYPWSTPQLTSPSKISVVSTKASAVTSMFSALEPRHAGKVKTKKKSPSLTDRPTGMIGVSLSPVQSSFGSTSPTSTVCNSKDKEWPKRNRAFSADAVSVSSKKNSSQDSLLSRGITSSLMRRRNDRQGASNSYAQSTVDFDECFNPVHPRQGSRMAGARTQPLHRPTLQRMQSMPISVRTADMRTISSISDDEDDEYEYYEGVFAERYTHSYHGHGSQRSTAQGPAPSQNLTRSTSGKQREGMGVLVKERGSKSSSSSSAKDRPSRDRSPKRKEKDKDKERPAQTRKRSGSVKSITSFFTGSHDSSHSEPPPLSASQRDSWVSKPAKYICQVVHPCKPPASVSYYSFPFFVLQEGEFYEVLQEAGHPSIHPKLPLYVDDGEDCLLLCRDKDGIVGWALASFLQPVCGT